MAGILFVCEGNLCRSPFAELVSKARLDAVLGSRIEVSSAGIRAQVGSEVPEPMADLVRAQGADPSAHRARQLDRGMIAEASLVLVAEGAQRSVVVQLHPPALHYAFTIRHLERALVPLLVPPGAATPLFDSTDPEAVTRVAETLRHGSGRVGVERAGDDDVIDPYGRSRAAYDQAVGQMRPALDLLVRSFGAGGLAPVSATPQPRFTLGRLRRRPR